MYSDTPSSTDVMYNDILPDTVYLNPMEYKSHRCAPPRPSGRRRRR